MAAPKRTKIQRERDLDIIADLYCKGVYQHDIAKRLKLSQPQIAYDLKEVQKRWRQSSIVNMNDLKQKELARLDTVEREAWKGYAKSTKQWQQKMDKSVEECVGVGADDNGNGETMPVNVKNTKSKVTRNQCGDPSFLNVINNCIAKRCAILGLDEPIKTEDVTKPKFASLPTERIEAIIATYANRKADA